MASGPPNKKWVDYSDDDSEPQSSPSPKRKLSNHHDPPSPPPPLTLSQPSTHHLYLPSKREIDQELDKLDDLDDLRLDQVWLEMTAWDQSYLQEEVNFLRSKAHRQGNIVSVVPTRREDVYHVKVYIKVAYDYVENGYDKSDKMKVTVADRNFQQVNQSQERSQRKKYVDKGTKDLLPKSIELGSNIQKTGVIKVDDRDRVKTYKEKEKEEIVPVRAKQQKDTVGWKEKPKTPQKASKKEKSKQEKKTKHGGKVSKNENPFELLDFE